MDELNLDEAQLKTRSWNPAVDLISGIRFYQTQYMFYQFPYLAPELKIKFVLDVFIKKCFNKTVSRVITTMTNLECITKWGML